jgi:hypothetical protein
LMTEKSPDVFFLPADFSFSLLGNSFI